MVYAWRAYKQEREDEKAAESAATTNAELTKSDLNSKKTD